MPLLRIPPEHQPGLTKLALLSDQVASDLRTALSAAARKKDGGSVSAEDLAPISELSQEDLGKIIEAVVGLIHARVYSDSDIKDFVKAVSESMRSAAPSDFPTTGDATDRFRKRIEEFVTIDEIARYAKSNILRSDMSMRERCIA